MPMNFEVRNRTTKGWFLLIFVSIFGSSESGESPVSAKRVKMVLVIMDLRWDTLVEAVEFPIRIQPSLSFLAKPGILRLTPIPAFKKISPDLRNNSNI